MAVQRAAVSNRLHNAEALLQTLQTRNNVRVSAMAGLLEKERVPHFEPL